MKKLYSVTLAAAMLLFLTTCGTYNQVSLSNEEFYNDNRIPDNIEKYDVYVHEGSNLYRLANRNFGGDTLRGDLEPVSPNSVNSHPETREEKSAAKNDVHIYLNKKVNTMLASSDSTALIKTVKIDRSAVHRVDMFAQEESASFGRAGLIIALGIVSILVAYFAIASLVTTSGNASGDSNSNSNSNSDGSLDSGDSWGSNSGGSGGSGSSGSGTSGQSNSGGSNSNGSNTTGSGGSGASSSGGSNSNGSGGSDSGGSDSGGSDSGGSDSGGSNSGCYVATMVYGSYDAPNVLILRSFRDRFLQRFAPGRAFISWYYARSPKFVAKHQDKPVLVKAIRFGLNIFVWLLRPIFGRA